MMTAQRTVDHLFGVPAMAGNDGVVYIQGHISNVPEVSKGIQNLDELKALGTGLATGLQRFAQETLNYMSKPNAVTDSLLQIGPALDNAVNYYANTPADQVGRDAKTAIGCAAEALESTLGYPLKPEQRGEQAGTLMPVFFLEGMKKPLHAETANQMGLGSMSESELGKLGIRKLSPDVAELHMPEVPEHLRHLELQKATPTLLDGMRNKGRTIIMAEEGSDDLARLKATGASGSFIMTDQDEMIMTLPEQPNKIAALEEFLHGTQTKLGTTQRLSAEIEVKEFMLRHANMLGLSENDSIVLQAMKNQEIERLSKKGFTWLGK